MTLGRTIGLILSSLPSQFIWAYHLSSQKFPRKPSRFNAREVFFLSWSLLARDANTRQPQIFCLHPLTAPDTRPASLREGSISPCGCCAIKSHRESSQKAEAVVDPGSSLSLLVLSRCLKPWKDHFCRAGLLYELICGIYSKLFCHLRRLPFDLRPGMGEECHGAPRTECMEVEQTACRWDVGEGRSPGPAQAPQ